MDSAKERVFIFDTTLRDGEQSPGGEHEPGRKTSDRPPARKNRRRHNRSRIPGGIGGRLCLRQTDRPEIRGCQIAGLARANKTDIDRAWEAVKEAAAPRIHTFISSSDIHLKYQLRKSREEVLKEACAAVKHACGYTKNVEFSPMDATRSDRDYLCEMVEAVIAAGRRRSISRTRSVTPFRRSSAT